MRHSRAVLLSIAVACSLSGGLAACGGSGENSIAKKVDQMPQSEQDVVDGVTATDQTAQEQYNSDAADARAALARRKKLADLEKTQQAETEKIMKEGVPGAEDETDSVPIGSADPDVEKFRAQLAGVCAGGQKRILQAGDDATKAAKTKDPMKILAAAQTYAGALDLFLNSLAKLTPPASMKSDYQKWLTTINDLASNVRLQLIMQGDPQEAAKLNVKTTKLATRLIEQSAALGVTCLSTT